MSKLAADDYPRRDEVWREVDTGLVFVVVNPGFDYHEVRFLATGQQGLIQPTHFHTDRYVRVR